MSSVEVLSERGLDSLVSFIFESGTLKRIQRSHCQTLGTSDLIDNIATHSFRCALIGFHLAICEDVDPFAVAVMCLLHDLSETRCGDQNWVHKRYVAIDEEKITEEQLSSLPVSILGHSALSIAREYHRRESIESKIAKDADVLEQVCLLREYEDHGVKEASLWLSHFEENNPMYSDTAKNLLSKIKSTDLNVWWKDIYTRERRPSA
ncbi:MAG: HD domain-containing protein [bacterium]|nr:HD domain-containing protein [bacterium]